MLHAAVSVTILRILYFSQVLEQFKCAILKINGFPSSAVKLGSSSMADIHIKVGYCVISNAGINCFMKLIKYNGVGLLCFEDNASVFR